MRGIRSVRFHSARVLSVRVLAVSLLVASYGCGGSSSHGDGGDSSVSDDAGDTGGAAGAGKGGKGGTTGKGGSGGNAGANGGAGGEVGGSAGEVGGSGGLSGTAGGAGGKGLGGSAAGGSVVVGTGGAAPTPDGGQSDVAIGPVTTPTSAMELCRSFCTRLNTCDTSRDLQTCVNACTNSNAALFPKLRTDIITSVATCIKQKDCATIAQDTSLRSCMIEAAAVIGPSPAVTSYCTAVDTAQTQCGVTIDKADCLTSVKVYTDATVADAMACAAKSCSLIYACTAATFTQTSGAWALGGGIKPGKKCSGTAYPCSNFSFSSVATQCQAAGCAFAPTCTGTVYCSYGSTMASCQAIAGCTWGTTCTGVPTLTCASLTTSAACSAQLGCSASGNCTGTVPTCSTLGVATCSAHPGCLIQDAL